MAKSGKADQTIYFKAKNWRVNGKSGTYAQVLKNEPLKNLDVAQEAVDAKRMSMSASELLNGVRALVDVMTANTATDLRPRTIDGFFKTDIVSGGDMETVKSPWDKSKNWCKVSVQLLKDSTKLIDGSFKNVETADIPRLNFVTALGSDDQNVLRIGTAIVAYGDKMQFSADLGDNAYLQYGEEIIPLICTSSDVAQAQFEFPSAAVAIPAGDHVEFHMNSRGGEADGVVTHTKKDVTVAAYSGNPIIAYFEQAGKARGEFGVDADAIVTIKGAGFTRPNIISAKFGKLEAGGNSFAYAFNPTAITVVDANTVTCKVSAAEDPDQTDETLAADSAAGLIVLRAFTQMTRSNDLVARYVA